MCNICMTIEDVGRIVQNSEKFRSLVDILVRLRPGRLGEKAREKERWLGATTRVNDVPRRSFA